MKEHKEITGKLRKMVLTNHCRALTQLFLDETSRFSLTTSELRRPHSCWNIWKLSDVNKGPGDRTSTPEQLTAVNVHCVRFLLFSGSREQFLSWCSKGFQQTHQFKTVNNRQEPQERNSKLAKTHPQVSVGEMEVKSNSTRLCRGREHVFGG